MSRQLLAKCGVFVLIVVNLGAYYLFWPESGSSGAHEDRQENPGNPLQITANASAAQPGETAKPARTPTDLVSLPSGAPAPLPLNIGDKDKPLPDLPPIPDPLSVDLSAAPVVVAQAEDPTIERLKRLKASFEKDSSPPAKPAPLDPPPVPSVPRTPAPNPLPIAPASTPAPTPTAPPAPKVAPKSVPAGKSPWTLQWEISDGRTTLTAKLHKRLDFRIVCDGVKMETQDGALIAIGKVSFSGPGLRGTCNQLTVNLGSDSVVLEGKAELHVQQGNPTDIAVPTAELKGERFALRLQQTAGTVVPAQAFPNIGSEPLAPAPTNRSSAPSPFTVPRP